MIHKDNIESQQQYDAHNQKRGGSDLEPEKQSEMIAPKRDIPDSTDIHPTNEIIEKPRSEIWNAGGLKTLRCIESTQDDINISDTENTKTDRSNVTNRPPTQLRGIREYIQRLLHKNGLKLLLFLLVSVVVILMTYILLPQFILELLADSYYETNSSVRMNRQETFSSNEYRNQAVHEEFIDTTQIADELVPIGYLTEERVASEINPQQTFTIEFHPSTNSVFQGQVPLDSGTHQQNKAENESLGQVQNDSKNQLAYVQYENSPKDRMMNYREAGLTFSSNNEFDSPTMLLAVSEPVQSPVFQQKLEELDPFIIDSNSQLVVDNWKQSIEIGQNNNPDYIPTITNGVATDIVSENEIKDLNILNNREDLEEYAIKLNTIETSISNILEILSNIQSQLNNEANFQSKDIIDDINPRSGTIECPTLNKGSSGFGIIETHCQHNPLQEQNTLFASLDPEELSNHVGALQNGKILRYGQPGYVPKLNSIIQDQNSRGFIKSLSSKDTEYQEWKQVGISDTFEGFGKVLHIKEDSVSRMILLEHGAIYLY